METSQHLVAFWIFTGITIFRQLLYFRHQHRHQKASIRRPRVVLKDKVGSRLLAFLYTVIWFGSAHELYMNLIFHWYVVGILLVVIGIVIRQKALKDLGKSYEHEIALRSDRKLITIGMYSWVRHPLYLALGIELLGMVFVAHALWIFVMWILIIAVLIRRTLLEDKVLEDYFGAEALNYHRSTSAVNIFRSLFEELGKIRRA